MKKELIFSAIIAIAFGIFFAFTQPATTGQLAADDSAQEDARGKTAFVGEISVERGELLLINETVEV